MPPSKPAYLLITLLALVIGSPGVFAAPAPELSDHGPIVLTGQRGQKIEYVRVKEPKSLLLKDCEDMMVFASEFRSVLLENCKNITIKNSWIHDSAEPGVVAEGCENIEIIGCRIERVASGLYALNSKNMKFLGNYVEDVLGPMPRGQMVQFDKVSGPENRIAGNYAMNYLGRSQPEDMISIYESHGEADDPIVIENNYLTGDPVKGSEGKSDSGSGIMLGDGGGSHILCQGNVLISPGQVGIGVAGGSDILVERNTVIGAASNVSNVGIYVWNQSKLPGGAIVVRGNKVSWKNKEGRNNGWWPGGGFSEVKEERNAFDEKKLAAPGTPSRAPMPPAAVEESDGAPRVPWGTKENLR